MMMNSGGGQGQQMMMGNQMGRTMSSPQGQMGGGQVMMGNNNMGRMGQQTMSMPGQMGGGQVMTMGNNMGKMGQQMGQQTMTMPGQMGGGQVMMMGNNTSTGQQTMPMSGQMGGGQVMTMGNNKMGQQTMSMPGQMGGGRGMNQIGNMHRPQSQMPIMPTGMQNPMMMQGSNQMMSNQMGGMMMQPTMKSMGSMNRRVQMMPNQMGGMGKVMSMPQNQMMMGGGQVMMGNQMGGMGQNQMQMMTGPNQMPMGNQQVNQGSPPTTGGETGMTFFDAVFPANSPLGLTVEDAHISYSVNVGNTVNMNRIEVCMVVASQSQTAILPGDVICSINNEKTINLPDSQGDVSKTPRIVALGIITQQQHMKRTLKIMRFRDPVSVLKAGTVLRFDNPEVLAQLFGYVGGNDQLMNNNNNSSSSNSNNNISSVPQQETTCHATYLAITFPPNQDSLGLKLEPIRKSYTLEETGQYKTIDCCIVTSSSISQYFRNGDILVKINGLALNSPTAKVSTNATEQDTFCSIVANKLKNANRTKGRTLVVLRQVCAVFLTSSLSSSLANNHDNVLHYYQCPPLLPVRC